MNKRWLTLFSGVALCMAFGAHGAIAGARSDIAVLSQDLANYPAMSRGQEGYNPVASAEALRDQAVTELNAGNRQEADRDAALGIHELGGDGVAIKDGDDLIPYQVNSGVWGMNPGVPAASIEGDAGPGPQMVEVGQAPRPEE